MENIKATPLTGIVGKTLKKVSVEYEYERIIFEFDDDTKYIMDHQQDCCESVTIEDICGEFEFLYGQPLLVAEERCVDDPKASESGTFTFYEFRNMGGSVTIRWYGTSNGYYSETVSFWQDGGNTKYY